MKICIIYPDYPYTEQRGTGDAKYTTKLARSICSDECEVIVVTSKTQHTKEAYSPQKNLTVYPIIENWGIKGFMRDYKKLEKLLKQARPDVINIIYPAPGIGSKYLLPYFIKVIARRIPVVTTLFHFFPKKSNLLYKCMAIQLYLSSKKIHFHDECLMAIFNRVFPFLKRRTFFIPVGNLVAVNSARANVDKEEIKDKLGMDKEFRYLSFIGYWFPGKGVDILLRALIILRRKGQPVKLLLIGGSSKAEMSEFEKDILRLIEELDLQKDVFITGHCSDEMMVDYLICSEMSVFPFKNNMVVMGRSSIMLPISLGLPMIITKPARQCIHFRDRENVMLTTADNPEILANTIEELLNNKALRVSLGSNAKKSLAAYTSWENITREWMDVYREIRA